MRFILENGPFLVACSALAVLTLYLSYHLMFPKRHCPTIQPFQEYVSCKLCSVPLKRYAPTNFWVGSDVFCCEAHFEDHLWLTLEEVKRRAKAKEK